MVRGIVRGATVGNEFVEARRRRIFLRKRFKNINFCCKKYKKNRLFKVKIEKKFGAEGAENFFPQQGVG